MVFDSESGLVYTEKVQRRCNCLRQSLEPSEKLVFSRDVSLRGARTLWDMARCRLDENSNKLTPESLEAVPLALLECIWPICHLDIITLQLWKIMAQGQPALVNGESHFWLYHCKSCRRLPDIIQMSNCPSYHWLTDLRLVGGYFSADDLFRIPDLRSIRSLVVQGSRDRDVTDRVFRAWAHAAIEQGAFTKLVSIAMHSAFSGSAAVLEQLQHFHRLKFFCAYDLHRRLKRSTILGGASYPSFRRIEPAECGCAEASRPIDTPTLQVTVGPEHLKRIPHDWYTVCFQRDSCGPTPASQKSSICNPLFGMPAKRRKLKDGKSLAVSDLLGGF